MNMAVKPGYKQTEVGAVPDTWAIRSLGSLAVSSAAWPGPEPRKDRKPGPTTCAPDSPMAVFSPPAPQRTRPSRHCCNPSISRAGSLSLSRYGWQAFDSKGAKETGVQRGHSIGAGDPNAPDVAALLAASEAHAHELYPAESIHMLSIRDLNAPSVRFLVARSVEGVAEGCGAVVLGADGFAEIKRMYVVPRARGQGIGSVLLQGLEAEARRAGMRAIRLETGPLQPEAIGLYRRFGYRERGPFGDYSLDPLSVFMEKELAGDQPAPPDAP